MIRETIAAIGLASRRAVTNTMPPQDWQFQVTQVREWSFVMPHLTRMTVADGSIHQAFLAPSRRLVKSLGPDESARDQVVDRFLAAFRENLTATLPSRRPIINLERLAPSSEPQLLRGVRSFILRHASAAGNVYLLVDVASRREYETRRDPGWATELERHLLPADAGRCDCIESSVVLDRVATYLTRCEQDVELLVGGPDGNVHATSGVVLRRGKNDGRPCLQLSLDLDRDDDGILEPGAEVEGAFGAAGRVLRFRTTYLGAGQIALDGLGSLGTVDLLPPLRYHLDQRRRYYRVAPAESLSARLQVVVPAATADDTETVDAAVVDAAVIDLSFSGAGLVCPGRVPPELAVGATVSVELAGRELTPPIRVAGVVRGLRSRPCGRGRQETVVGLEFTTATHDDRVAAQRIRQFVMARQRHLLSLRNRQATVQPI